ncbi:HEAT repeat domain-containing protein [Paludisphaera rhizosphaerae]|uniref:HEAT repeat domain-containing protein n=1 Tax=Paludisphaera rhizosphaerae TaxID=2711216 RepID=UPI0013EDCC98|nr:HEAT repeat domain-containing protein [Paludisphaera rhizosphaerae]
MAKRSTFDDKLAALRKLRDQDGPNPGDAASVRKAIGDRSNFVVAAAADVAGAWRLAETAPDLEKAFDRFMVDPVKDDKNCRAKIAAVQALEKLEHERAEVFEKAARHIQPEPVWGGTEDTAPPLRSAAMVSLTRINPTGLSTLLVDALVDPARDVRCTAASCLGAIGSEAAALALRLKAHLGDKEPEVVSEVLRALLTVSAEEYLPFVRGFLNSPVEASAEAAALAMGNARLPQALGPLLERFHVGGSTPLRETILISVAMLRASAALDALLELAADDFEPTAKAALNALKIHKHDPKLVDRLAASLKNASRAVREQFARDFKA